MEYTHLEKNENGEVKLKNRETLGYERVDLTHSEQGVAKQREIEKVVGKQRAVEKRGGQLQVGATAAGVRSVKASRSRSGATGSSDTLVY